MQTLEVASGEVGPDRLEIEYRNKLQHVLLLCLFGGNEEDALEWIDKNGEAVSLPIDNNGPQDDRSRDIRKLARTNTKAGYLGAVRLLIDLLPSSIVPIESKNVTWPSEDDLNF